MKYFIDTEFIEGFHKPLFGKRRHFIDLISIGIVAEDGSSYSAIRKEYKFKNADSWVQENVILPLYKDNVSGDNKNRFQADNFQYAYGKSNKKIATEIMQFIWADAWSKWMDSSDEFFERGRKYGWSDEPIEFYGYYADYDWVLFCSLFGRMIDLPKDFPMYCRDLKQMLDEKIVTQNGINFYKVGGTKSTLQMCQDIKKHPNYPKQENEHNALADAKWNKKLYEFLNTI